MPDKGIKKILVRAPNWIGDAVMCLPAVDALKRLYPESRITVLAKARAVPVFLNNPAVDEVVEYEDKKRHSGLFGRIRLSGEIRRRGYDLAVLFQNAFDAAFIAFLARVPERAGYARDFRSALLTVPVPATKDIKSRHQIFYYLNIVSALGGAVPEKPVPAINISKDEAAWADSFIRENGLSGKELIGAAPGASYGPSKRWMPERFSSVLERLVKERNGAALIFGGADDKDACKEVAGALSLKLDLSGKLSLRESMALISRLTVFITNDSGPMHIGAALGAPTVAIFGSTDDSLTGPLGKKVKVMNKRIECSPCFDRECRFRHYKCLFAIEADEVLRAAEGFMAR